MCVLDACVKCSVARDSRTVQLLNTLYQTTKMSMYILYTVCHLASALVMF